jgi:hypothetical protein
MGGPVILLLEIWREAILSFVASNDSTVRTSYRRNMTSYSSNKEGLVAGEGFYRHFRLPTYHAEVKVEPTAHQSISHLRQN